MIKIYQEQNLLWEFYIVTYIQGTSTKPHLDEYFSNLEKIMQETPVAFKSNAHIFVLGYIGGQEGYRKIL